MKPKTIRDGVVWMGAIDWNRRLFDSLIPLPDGTTYNAYLVKGSEKTALLDTVDPAMKDVLMSHLATVDRVDYVVSHHAEQDHSGSIPAVLERYPDAKVLCSPKAKPLLSEHLEIGDNRITTVEDGETLSLGEKTLHFLHMPWVHWPETMVTHIPEVGMLFTCDLFGSHLATSSLCVGDEPHVCEAAKRYYAEIMMPFRSVIKKYLERIAPFDCELIAPSHGPVHTNPKCIQSAYSDWVSDAVKDVVVAPFVSMHGSTETMVDYLLESLMDKGTEVHKFDLGVTDIGKLAMALVDAATIVIGTPTVYGGPHPTVFFATHLANALRPKLKYATVIGSYGWGTKAVEQIAGLIPNLDVEVLDPVLCKGRPGEQTYGALDRLAEAIKTRHDSL